MNNSPVPNSHSSLIAHRSSLQGALGAETEKLLGCIHCGLCLPVCPTYTQLGNENDSPRGRIYLMRAVAEGRLDARSDAFGKHIDLCLGCRACETACPAGVRYGFLLEAAREEIIHQTKGKTGGFQDRMLALALRHIFPYPERLSKVFAIMRFLRRSSIVKLIQREGLLRSISPQAHFGLSLLLSTIPHEETSAAPAPQPKELKEATEAGEAKNSAAPVTVFTGCVMEGLFQHANQATSRVLAANGNDLVPVPTQVCCGALHAHAGDMETARTLARQNIDAFRDTKSTIIINAAGCGAILKEYGELLKNDPEYAEKARGFAARVRDVSEYLAAGEVRRGASLEMRVTYDAPCHLYHAQRVTAAPQRLLAAIPGLDYAPLDGMQDCCGGAGIYNLSHAEMSESLLGEKIEKVKATGADVLATANPGCHMQLGAGVKLSGQIVAWRTSSNCWMSRTGGRDSIDESTLLSQLFALVRLRYKLIWAQARTTSGRMAVLFVVYLVLLLVGLFLVLGGAAAAVAGIRSGEGETIARGTLTGLMVSAIITSLVFGVGPRTAFADEVLRRYPLNAFERSAARHFVGIIDPIWFLLSASAVGLAIGLAWLNAGSLVWGLPAALFYIAICYLTTVFLLSLLDRFLRTPTGAAIVGGIALTDLVSGLAMTWLIEHRQDVWIGKVNEALRWFPSGLAAASMISAEAGGTMINFIALIGWGLLLLLLTRWSERRPATRRSNSRGAIDWDNFYDRFAALFGRRYAPLMGKALRYNLRSNRVRFGLATTPLFVFVGQFIPPMESIGMAASEFYVTLAVFAFLGFSWPSAVTINQFGADGAGMRRYGLLPAPFAAAARAGSLAAVMLGVLVIPPTITLWAMVTPVEVEWRMIAMLLGNSLTGLLIFNALGLWTTILSPRRVDFTSLLGNQSALGGNLVIIGGMLVIYGSLIILLQLRMSLETMLDYWWVAWALAFASLLFYLFTWKVIGRVADACRDRLIKTIAG